MNNKEMYHVISKTSSKPPTCRYYSQWYLEYCIGTYSSRFLRWTYFSILFDIVIYCICNI